MRALSLVIIVSLSFVHEFWTLMLTPSIGINVLFYLFIFFFRMNSILFVLGVENFGLPLKVYLNCIPDILPWTNALYELC